MIDQYQTNVLYFSNTNNFQLDMFSLVKDDFKITHITNFKDFKLYFNSFSIIFINISEDNDIYIKNTLEYIKDHKQDQKILMAVNESSSWIIIESIKNKVNDFIFLPFDENFQMDLKSKFDEFYKELNFLLKIYDIKSFDLKNLKKELSNFYGNQMKEIVIYKKEFLSVLKIIIQNEKYTFKDELYEYFSNFFDKSRQERLDFINKFALKMLYLTHYDRVEDSMIRPLVTDVITEFKEVFNKEKWTNTFLDNINIFFEFEIKIMGLNLKYEIQSKTKEKERKLYSNSLHYFMASSSDKTNNFLSTLDSKLYNIKKLISLFKENKEIPEKKFNAIVNSIEDGKIEATLESVKSQSRIFTTFKDEIKDQIPLKELVFLMEFAYLNGMKIKDNKMNITINHDFTSNELNDIIIRSNEHILLASIYAIIENAIESSCSIVNISIQKKLSNICIIISNDGEIISKDVEKNLFNKFFSTKDSSGLGLYIAKEWLNSINYTIEYISSIRSFVINIPIIQEINQVNNKLY